MCINMTNAITCTRCNGHNLTVLGPGNYFRDISGNYVREMCYQCTNCHQIICITNKN